MKSRTSLNVKHISVGLSPNRGTMSVNLHRLESLFKNMHNPSADLHVLLDCKQCFQVVVNILLN